MPDELQMSQDGAGLAPARAHRLARWLERRLITMRSEIPVLAREVRADWQLYLLLAPLLIWFAVFLYKPMWGLQIAFKDYSLFRGIAGSPWIGLENFLALFSDEQFLRAVRNTLTISIYSTRSSTPG
jgi:putative aldouronate transport system permease protein